MIPVKPFNLFGIFGYPLGHTLSPAMQEAAFVHQGIKAYYLALELDLSDFRQTMRWLSRLQLKGFNVTVPYKEEVLPYLDDLTPEARAIQAVNTVFIQGRRWVGANTDVYGFLRSLKEEGKFSPRRRKALIFGAGGSARAAIYGLAKEGIQRIQIANRSRWRAKKIIRDMSTLFPRTEFKMIPLQKEYLSKSLNEVDLVINATSVGLSAQDPVLVKPSWVPKADSRKRLLFFDLVYRPSRTPFLKIAESRGHRVLNGRGMLLFQGARAWEYWTGKKAPVHVMRRTLEKALKESGNA